MLGDRYVSLGEPVADKGDGAWGVRVYVKPFIDWIWGGCFLMALGGFIAMSDRRYRFAVAQPLRRLAGARARRKPHEGPLRCASSCRWRSSLLVLGFLCVGL